MSFKKLFFILVVILLVGCKQRTNLQEGTALYQNRDFQEALGFLEKSCIQEGGYGCELTAYLYSSGKGGIKISRSRALKALEFSCTYGNVKSCGIIYRAYKNLGLQQEAYSAMTYACDGGDYRACFELSKEYFWGKTFKKDIKRSFELAEKSCYGGSSEGCLIAITFYENASKYPFIEIEGIDQKIQALREKRHENIKNLRVLEPVNNLLLDS